jgi:HEPN domain-containing protein
MNEFTKTKMHFTLALLGSLFALHPFLKEFEDSGFWYMGYFVKLAHAYVVFAGLLAVCIYLYGVTLVGERSHSWVERLGNYCYGLAIMSVPFFGGLYLASRLAEHLGQSHIAWLAPALGVGWFLAAQAAAWFLRGRLGAHDQSAKAEQFTRQEVKALADAQELFDNDHYDLSVMEAYRAIDARLRRALLNRGTAAPSGSPEALVAAAKRAGLLREAALTQLDDLTRQWHIAIGSEPLTRDAAARALEQTRQILSTIPLPGEAGKHGGK